jgi:uncharacterized protein (DUF1330 family)
MYRAVFADLRFSVEDVPGEGDRSVIHWTARGTHQGELARHRPNWQGIMAVRKADNGRETAVAGYVIVEVEVTDPEPYARYRARVPATVERYEGRFLVRGGTVQTLEGAWQPQRIVVLEFPSVERAWEWYNSPEYQEILAIRERHARSRAIIVEGV